GDVVRVHPTDDEIMFADAEGALGRIEEPDAEVPPDQHRAVLRSVAQPTEVPFVARPADPPHKLTERRRQPETEPCLARSRKEANRADADVCPQFLCLEV